MRVLGRVRRRRGIDHDVPENENAIGREIENASETGSGSRGGMGQVAEVVRGDGTVGLIIHMRVEIGRWRKEWDFDSIATGILNVLDCIYRIHRGVVVLSST